MIMVISENRCPNCGVVGKSWKKKPEVFLCPLCSTIFNEFGLVAQGQQQDMMYT